MLEKDRGFSSSSPKENYEYQINFVCIHTSTCVLNAWWWLAIPLGIPILSRLVWDHVDLDAQEGIISTEDTPHGCAVVFLAHQKFRRHQKNLRLWIGYTT